jgi:MucB/RseB N-terminal domain
VFARNGDFRVLSIGLVSLVLLAVLPGCGGEVADPPPGPAVERLSGMLEAERTLSYEAMKELHWISPRGDRWKFQFVQKYANGPSFVEGVGEPAGRSRRWMERFGRLYWLGDQKLLLENYRVREIGRGSLVGRETVVLEIESKHAGRPSIELVLDAETNLLLGADFRNYEGKSTFCARCTSILFDPELPPLPATKGLDVRKREGPGKPAPPALSFIPLEPKYLPEGFVKKSSCRTRFSRGQKTIYTDGLSWIEVSVSKAPAGSPECVVRQFSRGNGTTMTMVVSGVAVRLVGRLSSDELLKVLRSLSPVTEP